METSMKDVKPLKRSAKTPLASFHVVKHANNIRKEVQLISFEYSFGSFMA